MTAPNDPPLPVTLKLAAVITPLALIVVAPVIAPDSVSDPATRPSDAVTLPSTSKSPVVLRVANVYDVGVADPLSTYVFEAVLLRYLYAVPSFRNTSYVAAPSMSDHRRVFVLVVSVAAPFTDTTAESMVLLP